MITPANSPVERYLSTAAISFIGTKVMCSVWLNGALILGLSVAATAPKVLPWNAFSNAMKRLLPVWNDASLSAFSLASAPELHRKSAKSSYPHALPKDAASSL